MSASEVAAGVTAHWDARAPYFNGAASYVRTPDLWKEVLAAAFAADRPKDVVDLGTGTGACALAAAALGHRVRAYDGAARCWALPGRLRGRRASTSNSSAPSSRMHRWSLQAPTSSRSGTFFGRWSGPQKRLRSRDAPCVREAASSSPTVSGRPRPRTARTTPPSLHSASRSMLSLPRRTRGIS